MTQEKQEPSDVVLVADDEALLRMDAAEVLEREGYEVLEASNAAEAIQVLESRPDVGVLFTDIQMPGELDGLDLARRVHDRWPEVLLLVTSGRLRPDEAEIPDDGRFLAKPYAARELLSKLRQLKGV
jgi:CheY-like chemotaxis protein